METIPAMTGLVVNGKINVIGFGNMPCSFTASDDVAGNLKIRIFTSDMPFPQIQFGEQAL
jgi:hypothetical protein